MQYIIDNLNQYLPEHAWPQVLSALRQDPLVWNSLLENQPLGETMFAQAGDNPTLWSPASLALAAIGQPINTAKNPSSEIRKTASAFLNDLPSSISIPSNETYSMEQAGWVAIGLQERLNNGTTWDSIKNDFAPCPTEFWKTPLACLFGLLPHPEDFIIDLLAPNSTAEHRRLGIHAVLSNPLSAEQQAALFYKAVRQHELASQVSLLGMISVQRQDIGKLLASQLTVDIEMQENQSLSNLHAIEERMLQAEVHQYGGEHSKALPALQSSWDAFQNYHYQLAAKLAFSAAYKNDSFSAVQTLEHANKIGANLGIKSADIALAKLALGQPSEFTSKQIGLELQAEPDEAYSQAKLAVQSNQLDAAYLAAKNALDQINQTYTSNTDSQGHDNFFRNQAVLEGLVDLFLELGHPGDASKSALLALSTNPNSPQLLSKLSAIQAKSGQTSNAVNTAQIAAALEPENLTYRRRLAEALVDAKEWSAANDQFAKVITDQQNPSVNDLLHMATCSLHLDQVQRAEDICKQAIELDPENGMAYTILGE
ncbi:MAG: hypothetical protein OEZ02_11160, partial [Anaerolineae bacterium]|nr:hypothetical protein [Anaerolineae bacterium]